jgi:hypothetical protein
MPSTAWLPAYVKGQPGGRLMFTTTSARPCCCICCCFASNALLLGPSLNRSSSPLQSRQGGSAATHDRCLLTRTKQTSCNRQHDTALWGEQFAPGTGSTPAAVCIVLLLPTYQQQFPCPSFSYWQKTSLPCWLQLPRVCTDECT